MVRLTRLRYLVLMILFGVIVAPVSAARVQDLVRVRGAESAGKLTGMGLVIGLNNTGDGKKSQTTVRRLAAMFNKLGDPLVTPGEINESANVAVVYLTVKIPSGGARVGDEVDVHLAAPFAQSLVGGRLVLAPMLDPVTQRNILGYAEGMLEVANPEDAPNTARIVRGATLRSDFKPGYLDESGAMTLVLDGPNATWPMANLMAMRINDLMAPDGPPIARALDQKNILVTVPMPERHDPGSFISQILEIQIDPTLIRTGARVVINKAADTIVLTGEVQISPVVVSAKGVSINVGVATGANTAPPTLSGLLTMLEAVRASGGDRVAIVRELHRSGKLHAQLIEED